MTVGLIRNLIHTSETVGVAGEQGHCSIAAALTRVVPLNTQSRGHQERLLQGTMHVLPSSYMRNRTQNELYILTNSYKEGKWIVSKNLPNGKERKHRMVVLLQR